MSHILATVTDPRDGGAGWVIGEAVELVVGPHERLDPPAQLRIGRALSVQDGGTVGGVVMVGGLQEDGLHSSRRISDRLFII
jgi:hypothetical protein